MNIKELLEKRAALLAELQKPETTAERFAEIRSEVDKINFTIEQIRKDDSDKRAEEERKAAEEADARAARLPNKGGVIFDQGKVQTDEKRAAEKEETEKRAKALKNGEKVAIEMQRRRCVGQYRPRAWLRAERSTPRLNRSERLTRSSTSYTSKARARKVTKSRLSRLTARV